MKTNVMTNLDMEVTARQNKSLKKRLHCANESLKKMRFTIGILIGILIVTIIALLINYNQIYKLQSDYTHLQKQYDSLMDNYVNMSLEYGELKAKHAFEKGDVKVDTNSVETSEESTVVEPKTVSHEMEATSVQYSLPGFEYNSNIPLSEDLQRYAFQKCKEYNIEYSVFLGLMRKESTFNPSAKSSTGDYGLCQINKCNHEWMKKVFGSDWDPMDPYDSIDASVYILDNYRKTYKCDNYHVLLMNYNMGHNNAVACFGKGVYSSKYSRTIMDYAKEYGYSGDGTLIY